MQETGSEHTAAKRDSGDSPHLRANLEALKSVVDAESFALLTRMAPSGRLELLPTRSGLPTARCEGSLLYSTHEPYREALRLIEREIDAGARTCVFYHFGLGYHPEAFLARYPSRVAVVVEPDISLFLEALGARDLAELLAAGRLHLVLGADPDVLPVLLDSLHASHLSVVRLRGLAAKDRDYFDRLDVILQSYLSRREINRNTLARFGRLWVRNLFRNLEIVATGRGIQEIQGIFEGIPALLLAAGPSLDAVLPHLPSLAQRTLVVAVDTSLRAALKVGVVPDFVVVVDPQYWNSRHLDGCGVGAPILVSESSTYPSVFRILRGPLFLCASLFPLGMDVERIVGAKGRLGAGGSVATTAWDFARSVGCRPIYLAGLDLGLPDLKTHFAGGFFEERTHTLATRLYPAEAMGYHALRDGAPFPELNNEGGTTLTDHRLIIYKWWFENQMKIHPDTETYSLSRRGVRIEGIPLRSWEEIVQGPVMRAEIDRRLRALLDGRPALLPDDNGALPDPLADYLARLAGELEEIHAASRRACSLIARLEAEASNDRPNLIRELEEIDRVLLDSTSREIAGFLLQGSAEEILDRQGAHDREGDPLADSARLYSELADSAAYHLALTRTTLKRSPSRPS